jgi:hypothetical protein
MSYTIGNWTVEPLTSDSISTAKALSLVDLDYATDYTVTERGTAEVRLANTTGAGLAPVEQLRYGRTRVKDIYASSMDVPAGQKCNSKEGIRSLHEIRYLLKATNGVSGQELLLPMRGWICLEVPTVDFISASALTDLFKRTVSAALATGKTDGTLVADVARGDLDPTA